MATRATSRGEGTQRPGAASDKGPHPAPASIAPAGVHPASPPSGYVVPIVHVGLSERAVNVGFWGVLAGSVALGVVDLPLAALIGAAVYVARHHVKPRT